MDTLQTWLQTQAPFIDKTTSHVFLSCDSTNLLAFRLIKTQKTHTRTLIWALSQTNGQGRQGRAWESPKGNLYFSLVLDPVVMPQAAQIPQAAAFCICKLLQNLGVDAAIKWPNDIVTKSMQKLGGILMQTTGHQGVLGIGINLQRSPHFPIPHAAFLSDFGVLIEPKDFLHELLTLFDFFNLDKNHAFSDIFDAINKLQILNQKKIIYTHSNQQKTGYVQGLNPDGSLRILNSAQAIENLYAGEVHLGA